MKCVILQPSYIPWRGFFHQIQKCDVFVFYDDVQYDKGGWRNRNRIKTQSGPKWLTIPVITKGALSQGQLLRDIRTDENQKWQRRHWQTLMQSYAKAPFLTEVAPHLEQAYLEPAPNLVDFTIRTTILLSNMLGIGDRQFLRSSDLKAEGQKTNRIISIIEQLGASHYISGPAAKAYLDIDKLSEHKITLEYMDYNYPEYEQLYPPFEGKVSIVDLLFMMGPDSPKYIWEYG